MNMNDFKATIAANKAGWQRLREDLLARAQRVQQALREHLGPLVVAGDGHVSEEELLKAIDAGEGPILCGCPLCCLRLALPSAILDQAQKSEAGR